MQVANKHGIWVVEDNAQAIGADYTLADGSVQKTGTLGHIGCTSFYPSKNLGAYGDGGALYTNDDSLGPKCAMMANHGQVKRYYHDAIGVNSRLDAMQAAILEIKLRHLDQYAAARQKAAAYYDEHLGSVSALQVPVRQANSSHVFHQYTLLVKNGKRDELAAHLKAAGVPSMIYYPVPLYKQNAYKAFIPADFQDLPITEALCESVISLPMHTELDETALAFICQTVKAFFA